jgi:PDZ domain-containing protein
VQEVIEDTPASGVLRPGDVVVEVDGEPIRLSSDLQEAIRSQPVGTTFDLTVERDGRTIELEVESTVLSGTDGAVGIGVFIGTRDFEIDLPFEVDFEDYDIGGPSAGLVYALAITDILDERDIAGGKSIAATGTIDFDGDVGLVGGVGPKADAVRSAGADVFLVPEGELSQALGDGVEVKGVSDLEEAVSVLEGATS